MTTLEEMLDAVLAVHTDAPARPWGYRQDGAKDYLIMDSRGKTIADTFSRYPHVAVAAARSRNLLPDLLLVARWAHRFCHATRAVQRYQNADQGMMPFDDDAPPDINGADVATLERIRDVSEDLLITALRTLLVTLQREVGNGPTSR